MSLDLSEEIYKITKNYPKNERFGVISQMQRSATSVGANLVEGAGRNTSKEFNYFLGISMGSLSELDYFVELSVRLKYLEKSKANKILYEINSLRKMIISLKKKLKT
ncbi:four helix bundle protein [Candidatus Dojkabacteria bacterium]|uniref:Four helix bundle protein n=1 Tax=Candidatus Dojkabacteria bacterium TaxID=2099670 RepID=A0A955IEV8_9BACT|nr:four helix bundle protein [Candidatus Dojkabacteria bacterium]